MQQYQKNYYTEMEEVIMHPLYNGSKWPPTLGYDLALIKTKTRMAHPGYAFETNHKFVNFVYAACLPLNDDLPDELTKLEPIKEPLFVRFNSSTNQSIVNLQLNFL